MREFWLVHFSLSKVSTDNRGWLPHVVFRFYLILCSNVFNVDEVAVALNRFFLILTDFADSARTVGQTAICVHGRVSALRIVVLVRRSSN